MHNVLWLNSLLDRIVWLSCVCFILDFCSATPRPPMEGHLLPLDKQGHTLGDITSVDSFIDPEEFYSEYVKPGKPLLFKGAAKSIPAFTKWTDEYLKKQYGNVVVDVEVGKKETREQDLERMPFEQFINAYNTEDIYMVQDVVNPMKGDLSIPRCLQCGGFQDVLEAAVIWFSSGGTKSVLHYDAVDNINCLLDGEKSLIMIDRKHQEQVEGTEGFVQQEGYSKVDVEKVDLKSFPQFQNIAWWSAHMTKGDCLYIPFRWYHTVTSGPGRNLAVNVWFMHRLWFDTEDCEEKRPGLQDIAPMDQYTVAGLDDSHSPENIRSEVFGMFEGQESMSEDDIMEMWELGDNQAEAEQAFRFVDKNGDNLLEWPEVYQADIMQLVQQFPFVFPHWDDLEDDSRDEL